MSQKSDKFTLLGEIFSQIFFRSKTSNGPKNNVYLLLFFYLFGPDWMRSRYSQKCLETFKTWALFIKDNFQPKEANIFIVHPCEIVIRIPPKTNEKRKCCPFQ